MRKIYILFILSFTVLSCNEQQKDSNNDFYGVINNYLKFNKQDNVLVVLNLINVTNDKVSINNSSKYGICFEKRFFDSLVKSKLLNFEDALFMYNQIDTLKLFTLDSLKINKRTIKESLINDIFNKFNKDDPYEILRTKYKAKCFVRFSIPIFSINRKKVLLTINSSCGWTNGIGMTYLFEKKNNNWEIIYYECNWIS